jgi:hypothetical protein
VNAVVEIEMECARQVKSNPQSSCDVRVSARRVTEALGVLRCCFHESLSGSRGRCSRAAEKVIVDDAGT